MARDTFIDYVCDQLRELGAVSPRRMFGGHGIYCHGVFFAIVADGRLYFKTGENNLADFTGRGMGPFRPSAKQTLKTYHEVPEDILEDPGELKEWARKAVIAQETEKGK